MIIFNERVYFTSILFKNRNKQIMIKKSSAILDLVRCDYHIMPATKEGANSKYFMIPAHPATGVLYITSNNPEFISEHIMVLT